MIKRFYILLLAIVASVGMSWATTTDLASITDNYTAQDGEILTGTLGVSVKISIADGATVTLLNANINGDKTLTTGEYAGLTCLGDATITIVGKNSVSGFSTENGYPGIFVPSGKTLIINGTGSLTAQSSTEEAAGIGARYNTHCGNIEIQSGKITAIAGGEEGAGIGGAYNASCGDITISGGIVTAVGGYRGAGIGGGKRGNNDAGHCGNILISGGVVSATSGEQAAAIGGGRGNNAKTLSNCGTITITNTALKVYADQGGGSTNTIGAGKYGNCGTVTIGGNTGVINDDPYTYRTKEDGQIVVDYINAIGTVVYTQECKDKIDIARELYDALEDSQKDLVSNYQILLDAEAAYAALNPQDPQPAGLQVTELQVPASWADNRTMLSISDMPGFVAITEAEAQAWDAAPAGKVDLIFAFEDNAATALSFKNGVYQAAQAHNITYEDLYAWYSNGDKIFYTGGGSTPDPDPTPTPSGDGDKLAGAFSVGGDKVVYFSKANLQATTADNGSTWTWGFAENQWDYVGNSAANNAINGGGTVSANGPVDLFAWSSTDNNYFGINNSINEADYSGNFKDWGAKMGSDWHTLTINEWQYLLQERNPGSSSANHTSYPRYTNAQILTDGTAPQKDIKGIILFPDDFNDGGESIDGVTWGSINPSFYSSYPTTCTTAGWATLESMGCVFLPSAGSRQNFGDEFAILDVNQMGNYWSSTLYSGEPEDPQSIVVGDGTLGIGTNPRYFGMSVRLVSETAPGSGSSDPQDPQPAGTVTVVFEANNNQKEVEVTLPHTFACDFENGNGELDGIIQELYALQYGGYCPAFDVPTATGNAAVTASKDGNNHYIAISEAFEGTATVTGNYIKYLDTEHMGNTSVDYTLTISVQGSDPAPTPAGNLKLIEFQVPASWENDNSPITSADFPDLVATTYEIASALPVPSDKPSLVVFDFPGDDEVSVYSKMGGQVSGPSTGTIYRNAVFEQSVGYDVHYFYTVHDEGGSSAPTEYNLTITQKPMETIDAGGLRVTIHSEEYADLIFFIKDISAMTLNKTYELNSDMSKFYCSVTFQDDIRELSAATLTKTENAGLVRFTGYAEDSHHDWYFTFDYQETTGGSTDVIPCTAEDLGKVLCTDGSIYATVSEATAASKTAVAMIAYVDTENGKALALALADDGGEMEWETAKTTAPAHTPAVSNGTWKLPTKDEWDNMITAAGGYEALRDGFSAVGGTNMQQDAYWSSTPVDDLAWIFYFAYGGKWVDGYVDDPSYVRACLAFDIPATPAAPAYETVMNLINEIPNPVVLTAECKAKIDAARAAFIALSDADKELVTNIATLTTAEAAFDNVMDIWLSGDCDAILWKDTTLTIRKHAGDGNGAMADYNYMSRAPWYSSHWYDPKPNDIIIKSVTVEEGVTHLGDYAFAWMSEMKTVTIPSSVTTIPEDAFYWSKAVDDIYLTADPSNLTWALPHSADNQFKPNKGTNCHVPADLLTAYQEKFETLNMTFVGDLDPITPLTPEQQQALDAVKGLINAIPSPVVYTPACKDAIDAARAAYDALTPYMLKQLVSNYATLTAAETTYANLKDVVAVEAKINAIPQPVELKLATRDSINNARAAYDALTADQQALVSNYQTLLDAEATMATLNPGGGMPAGALNGKFTINEDGDQISFAKGNLQATTANLGETWTWGFAANQWDLIGNAAANNAVNGNGTVSENGTVDLFGWSTPTTYYGIHNSKNNDYYSSEFREWGENITGATWKTLNPSDWNYIIKNRADAAQKHGQATVNGVNGYIFLPDEWELPSGLSFTAKPNNWTANVYEGDDWTAMENAGALFLPMSPWRAGNTVTTLTAAYYWTSDYNSSYMAMAYSFQEDASVKFTGINRYAGIPVRLVTAGGASPTPLDSAQAVKDLIDAIPVPVTLEDACVNAVQAARDAYNALSDAAKGALDDATVQKLNQAIADYTALIQAGADEVIAKINNIPQPVELKLATRDSIESARAAYDALTADQQALVSNYDVLTAAEATWAGLINVAPAGALSGKYTINADGDVIYFAHGNLQYTRENLDADWSTGTFRLAENQYDMIEEKASPYCTDNYGDKTAVGLFGWSTWGEGKTPNLTSSNLADYTWSTDFVGTLEGTSTWRTLTKDEWVYLLTNHNMTYATVHGVHGLLIAPDGVDFDQKDMTSWNVVISDDDWTNMQNDGVVFLPACGQRSQLSATAPIKTGGQGEEVLYYSSTEYDANKAYNIWYEIGSDPINDDYSSKRQAFGIRLVSAGVNPLDQAQAVKDLIDAIPMPVTLEDACVKAIEDARTAYDALSEDAQGIIDAATVQKLTDAEQALKDLNQAVADEVIAKINNIPLPVELKLATRDSIESARAAYEALNAAQQALVSNYQTLLDAEAALAEKNKGGSASVDIVWDGNTGIEGVSPATTSPAYEGMTVTVGNGSSFSTYQNRLYFTFYSQPNGGFIFANENGTNITKVVIESTTALTSTMKEVDRMGSGWVISNENKTATWTGNADSVSIWEGQSFTNYWVVDTITFTVNASSTPLDSAQAVKDLIDAIPTPLEYPTSGAAIEAALNAYDALSDAAKGALDDADVQKLNDAATQYAALEAIAAIEAIPAEVVYDLAVKAAIETARETYDALSDASKALVDTEILHKLTNAEEAWAILAAKVEHNVTYIGKDGILKQDIVALLNVPDPAPDFNGYEFVRWDVKAGDFLEEGLRIKAIYTPIITTNPVAYDSLMYNGMAQTLITAGVAKEGHIEYRINDGEWSAELPKATFAGVYAIYYKLVREGHADYIAPEPTMATIAKVPVTYVAPTAVESLVYTASNQTLIAAGQTNDGTFEYSLDPTLLDSWKAELPQAKDAGTYSVYYRVQGDLNHLDSTAVDPIAVTIAKAELTATADDKNVIYGDAVPAYTVTYAGWQGEDGAAAITGDLAFACEYAPTSNVGTYTITPSGVSAANYTITFVNGKVTVAKAESGCIAPVVYDTLVYNGANQTLIIAGQPMGGEMQYSLDTTVLDCWSTSLPQAKDAGTYNVYYRVKGDMNHNDHYYDLITVSIAKATLTATADDKNVVYGDAVPEYTVSYSGWMGTDEASVLTGTIAFACEYAPTSNVGDYTITPSGVDAANYSITFVNGKVAVAKADLMITADDKSVIYGDAVPEYTATYSGFKNDDTESVVTGLVYTCEYDVTSNVGDYTITPSGATATNYAISFTNGKVTVAQAALTITANDTTVIYGDEHPEFTVTYAGWKNTDDESVVSGLQFSTPYAPGSYIGTYAINPNSATALNYAITFVDGTLTVNKAHVYVSDAEVHIAKFADGHAGAEVTNNGVLNGIKLNDPIAHVTTAAFSSADVAENLTITLFYELTGDAALLNNYNLDPTSEIFTTEGVIIEPFIPDNEEKPEDEEATVNEGIEIYAYGYCDGSGYSLKYHLESGNPDQYKIDFADSRFTDVDWTNLVITGKDGTIDIEIPVDLPTGDYSMTVYFRDSRFDWLESRQFNVTFHVNLPETYVRPLFENVIALVDTCHCLTDIQWYWRANSTDLWQPIEGANGYYYHVDGKLTGEYFVKAKMNGEPTYTCGQTDMETLYGETQKASAPVVKAYPNLVESSTTVTIENSEAWKHNLRIVNLMGIEVMNATFEGDKTSVEMGLYPQGNYLISVDGITVKVLKQ